MSVNAPRFSASRLTTSLKNAPSGQRSVLIHQTQMFRHGKFFTPLADEMLRRFPEGAPVYCYAASDGSEPYSLALKLMDREAKMTPAQQQTFFPIKARDISPEIIETANYRTITLHDDEPERIAKETSVPFDSVFQQTTYANGLGRVYHVLPKLFERVKFTVADIAKDAKNKTISDKPCVVFFRNAWYHLYDMAGVARSLFEAMKPGSLLVVGDTEIRQNNNVSAESATPCIEQAGFKLLEPAEHYDHMVYERR